MNTNTYQNSLIQAPVFQLPSANDSGVGSIIDMLQLIQQGKMQAIFYKWNTTTDVNACSNIPASCFRTLSYFYTFAVAIFLESLIKTQFCAFPLP